MGPMISALEKAEIFHGHMVTFKVPMARRPNELRQVMHPGRLRRVPATAGLSGLSGLWAGSGNLDGASKEHDNFSYFSDYMEFPYRLYWDYMGLYGIIWMVMSGSGWWLSHPSEK